ncbi:hypothetical protein VMCG_00812 [Cytospora schulzeri]|uniref:Uncharacterized protein n=1 Tax=Cytospora schulzeri TaxID=448051 RepID=A0A423XA76_9PEZI|nr:hypothetical protein VMCG_00812 [Valsa malicola]
MPEDSAQHRAAETAGTRLKFLFSVVRALVDRLASCSDGHRLPWQDLLVAIDEGPPPRLVKPFSKKLKRLKLVPEDWKPGPIGPAVLCPSAARKRNLGELPASGEEM